MNKDDLTKKQLGPDGLSQYAVFLPAISGFYATFIGAQRASNYVDPARMPGKLKDMEMMNWLNDQKGLFPYKWSLYSGGHANLDLNKPDPSENMVRDRDPNTIMLGDSGGFQIAKGLWEGDWRDPNSVEVQQTLATLSALGPQTKKNKKGKDVAVDLVKEHHAKLAAAQKKRETVLKWLDGVATYGMTLDIPTWVVKNPIASKAVNITTHAEAVAATKYNNEYFIKHRKGVEQGGAKFLNVLQGATHADADDWYETMKDYCDPIKYPGRHFNGWGMGGQNMADIHLVLKRLVALRHDNLLQTGIHDWMHFLGISKLEWAVLLTAIQRSVRKYINPQFTISFDCASPFLATANGQVYYEISLPAHGKWSYRMAPGIDNKKFALDTRTYRDAVLAEGIFPKFEDSPISKECLAKDICIYKPGVPKANLAVEFDPENPEHYDVLPDKNKNGKWGRTSWDSFSYALLMGHNVWLHLESVQRANREYDAGTYPKMLRKSTGDCEFFSDIVDAIFATPNREESEAIIDHYAAYWEDIKGGRGLSGKGATNSRTQYNSLFEEIAVDNTVDDTVNSIHEEFTDSEINQLDRLETEQQ